MKKLLPRWQANFWTGLAVVLPGVISVAVLVWLFGTVARITDLLLFFLPQNLTHRPDGDQSMFWYWSVVALVLAIVLICLVGLLARNYFGKRLIKWVDTMVLRVPLLNKIYAATKQVNDAFSASNKTAFRTVVLVEFPRPGAYTLGFITSEQHAEVQAVTRQMLVCVFVPTTPNPTGGFLLMVPEEKLTRLKMSVPEAIKYIVSLGSILPEYAPPAPPVMANAPPVLVSAGHD